MGSSPRLRTPFESLESRQLLTFVTPNVHFGDDGFVATGKPALVASQPPTTIYPLNDGRLIFRESNRLHYLHGDGAADTKRADHGDLTIGSNELIAVDARTGYMARVKQKTGQTRATITLYDPKGLVARSTVLPSDAGVTYRSIALNRNGGLVLMGSKLATADASHQVATLLVRRFDSFLNADSSAGSIPRTDNLDPHTISSAPGVDSLTYGTVTVDEIGRIYLPYTSRIKDVNDADLYTERVVRLNANGTLDTSYGSGGVARVYQNEPDSDVNVSPVTLDRAFDPHTGASYVLWSSVDRDSLPLGVTLNLTRVAPNGQVSDRVDVLPASLDKRPKTGRIAVDSSGNVSVLAQDNGAGLTQLRTYSVNADGTLTDPRNLDTFGEASRLTFPLVPNDVVSTPSGALVMSGLAIDGYGNRTPALYSTYDEVVTTGYTNGKAVELLGDGTLVARGGTGNDTISISQKHDVVSVTVNRGKAVAFDFKSIRGIVVEGGKGNDHVDLQAIFAPSILEGGAGNDTLLGSDAGLDTIFGNSGDDEIEGRGGDDQLAGNGGNDTLLGGRNADWLIGGDGDDALYASGFARNLHAQDGETDTLTGGAGADLFRVDREGSAALNDVVTDSIKNGGDRVLS